MKLIVAGQDAATPDEFAELAFGFGIDAELFTGTETETTEERRARLDAARDILRDLDPPAARFASALMRTAERRRVQTWRAAA
ncbi:hypothetical protein [Streptomyces sp. CB01881]|uniref:hypothetical protein n=1 Tax=Streptomyces sp. CB01881 TaxID=2078691 RepID=UPI000CDC2E61|nr:hypothetical protein [Streptomyces sp. CB01881]AUY50977.1 hypothetical protein C2142_20810 [Streptomyces sp. CB01881]TYC74361.1 hypothetical protein EH183_20775 [Streptomyces sp. CB01881]